MEPTKIKCPSCGREVLVDGEAPEVFCTYCGTRFATKTAAAPVDRDEARAYLESAFANGAYGEVVSCAREWTDADAADSEFGAWQWLGTLYDVIEQYKVRSLEVYKAVSVKNQISRIFTSHDRYGEDAVHTIFFADAQNAAKRLAECLGGLEDGSPLAQKLSLRAVTKLLDKPDPEKEAHIRWTMCVLDHYTVPMLPFLETQALLQLYTDYAVGRQNYDMLPNQVETAAAMKKELQKRGAAVPKPSFGQKLQSFFGKKS